MENLGAVLVLAGTACMVFAGLRYWRSDLLVFLLTPLWDGDRRLFAGRGWHVYLAGTAMAIAGSVALVAARVLPLLSR